MVVGVIKHRLTRLVAILGLAAFLVLTSTMPVSATTIQVDGVVTDLNGNGVGNALVHARNIGNSSVFNRTAITNPDGSYEFELEHNFKYHFLAEPPSGSGLYLGGLWDPLTIEADTTLPPMQLTAIPAPSHVDGIAATAGDPEINWPAVSGADHYNVYRKENFTTPADTFEQIGTSNTLNFTDTTVPYTASYTYAVTAVDSLDREGFYINHPGTGTTHSVRVDRIPPPLVSLSISPTQINEGQSAFLEAVYSVHPDTESGSEIITDAEYFEGPDPGVGNGIPMTVHTKLPDQTYPVSATISSATRGVHTFYVRAADAVGNWSQVTAVELEVGPLPQAPVNLDAYTPTNTSPTITWDAVSGADFYDVFRNGTNVGTTTIPSFIDSSLSEEGNYEYYVVAVKSDLVSELSDSVTVLFDSTNPTISYELSPSPSVNGWNNSDVTVTFTCDDALSGVESCSDPVTMSDETDGQEVTGTATDAAGNSATVTATVKLDKTQPTISYQLDPAEPNANGWYDGEVTVAFTCEDALSDVQSCSEPVTLSSEGADQTVTGIATDNAGNTVNLTTEAVDIDLTAPDISYDLSPVPNEDGWNNSDVTVTFTCADALSGISSCPEPVTLTDNGANQTVEGTATDNAGNTASTTATVNIDETAPTISYTLDPAPNAAGWNNSNVTVNFDCEDSLSGVETCSDPVTVTSETSSQDVVGTVTDEAGNTATVTATIKLDKTTPAIDYELNTPPNANGWHNTDVTVTFTCEDEGSGIDSCTDPVTVSSEGGNQVVTGTATDNAGNTETVDVTLNIDKTAPTITYTLDPAANANGWNNSDVTLSFDCQDGLSGVDNCTDPTTISTEGDNHQVPGTAADLAGNTANVTATVKLDKTNPTVGTPTMSGLVGGILIGGTTDISAAVGDNLSGAVYAEYYFDSDPGQGNGTSMNLSESPTTNGTASATADVSGLSILSQHTLYVRVLDDAGNWSTEAALTFFKLL